MDERPVIVWFRRDWRIGDNAALEAAAGTGRPKLALYILDRFSPGRNALGAAQKMVAWRKGAVWFHDTLVDAYLACNSASWRCVDGYGPDAASFL